MALLRKFLASKTVATMATPHTLDHFPDQLLPMPSVQHVPRPVYDNFLAPA